MTDYDPPDDDETYVGICPYCGAKHEVGGELEPGERGCMCGGPIVKADALGQLAHRLWGHWSQSITDEESISDERVSRWESLWLAYPELPQNQRRTDRELVEQYLGELETVDNNVGE